MRRTELMVLGSCLVLEAVNLVALGLLPLHIITVVGASAVLLNALFRVVFGQRQA